MSIRLAAGRSGAYEVIVEGPEVGSASGEFEPPFDEQELTGLLGEMTRPRTVGRSADPELPERARAFGEGLMEALIESDSVRDLYRQAVDRAKGANEGLRISLKLPTELMDVPWELLCDRGRFLSHSVHTPVVRSLDLGHAYAPPELSERLTILVAISQPVDLPELAAEKEKESLQRALRPLEERELVEVRWLERATLEKLAEESRGANVIHYIGHGEFDNDRGSLLFEEEDGRSRRVAGNRLAALLQDEHSLRLVVLNSCEGARTSERDPFSGVATSLLNVDIPAVIGMQFAITDSAAIAFSKSIYEALAENEPIDAALARARRTLLAGPDEIAFATPVLFLQRRETQLFKGVAGKGKPAPVAAPAVEEPAVKPEAPAVGAGATSNHDLLLGKVSKLEGTVYPNQKKALLKEIREDEKLFGILRCGLGNEAFRATVLVLTSNRVIAVRESLVSSTSVRSIPWQEVFAVSDEGESLRLNLQDGSLVQFTRIKGPGISLDPRIDMFDSASIAALAAGLIPTAGKAGVDDHAEFNRRRLVSMLGTFSMSPQPDQKDALLKAVKGDEDLLAICRCVDEKNVFRSTVFLLTSKRLLTCRQSVWASGAELQSLPWSEVRTVNTRDAFLDFVKHDGGKASFSRFNEGEVCDGRKIGFEPPALREAVLKLIEEAS